MATKTALDTKRSGKVISFRGQEESDEVQKMLADFKFDIADSHAPKVVMIWGGASTGKSHLAATLSKHMPVYVLDTEARYAPIAEKFGIKTWKHVGSYEEMFVFVRSVVKQNMPKGVFIFDSATDIKTYAEQRFLVENGKDVVGKARNWGGIWDKIDWFLDHCKENGHWVIFTARQSDVYANDQPTGDVKPNSYTRIEYWSDLIVQCKRDGTRVIHKPLQHQLPADFVVTPEMDLMDILKGAKIVT